MDYLNTYRPLFQTDNYNVHIYDKSRYDYVIDTILKNGYKTIIDISAGRGYFEKYLLERGFDGEITTTDLEKFHNYNIEFIKLDLSNLNDYSKISKKYDMLVCLDVLEHIESSYIDDVLLFLSTLSSNFCFSIANHVDIQNGIDVHLIKENKEWWDIKLKTNYNILHSFTNPQNTLYCYTLQKI